MVLEREMVVRPYPQRGRCIVPDSQRKRGPHPEDLELFGEPRRAALLEASSHYAWLLTRGYSDVAALKLVGDHFALTARQRQALRRSICGDSALASRKSRWIPIDGARHQALHVDGFNVLITVEVALSGGLVLIGREGAHRDLASVHGTYRSVDETRESVDALVRAVQIIEPRSVDLYLDAPVSNSGKLARLIAAREGARSWSVQLVPNPDRVLRSVHDGIVASSDGAVIEDCSRWVDLAEWTMEHHHVDCWTLDFRRRSGPA